jgi:NADPH-dependent 2,4-dienoyl-CoA reductase/sulfur reductase-like enzyme/bacterioferritin-associated ferredoxin
VNAATNPPMGSPPSPDADVIVIGAGPAGMTAAIDLSTAGKKVIVLDMQAAPGGQVFRSLGANLDARPTTDDLMAALGPGYRAGEALIRTFQINPAIDYRPNTTVWDLRADGTVGWLYDGQAGYIRARHVLLATGAMERPVPFPGWTLPGVMTAGAVQTLIKAGRLQPEGRIVLAGTGPLIFLLADQLRRLGVKPVLIARTDRLRHKLAALPHLRLRALPQVLKGLAWLAQLRLAGIPIRTGVTGLKAIGQNRVQRVSVSMDSKTVDIPCDLLIVHDGIVPATDLAHAAGISLKWQQAEAGWCPVTQTDGLAMPAPGPALTQGPCRIHISGDARRIGGADAAIAHGKHAAQAILAALRGNTSGPQTLAAVNASLAPRPFLERAFPPGLAAGLPEDQTIICRCEEVTAGEIRGEIRGGATDINLLRGILRCGMGSCQGRNCAATVARLLAEADPKAKSPPAPFRARPPARPLPLGALAGLTGADPALAEIISLQDKPAAMGDGPDA